jgi:hypothetical protein
VDACQRDRHERVAERPDMHRPGVDLARAARDHETPRRAAEGEDALFALSRLPGPDEEPGGAEIEPSDASELHLDRALDAADALRPLSFLGRFHLEEL